MGAVCRLDDAVRSNCLGALQVAEFAASIEGLEAYVHVSTAYVNSHIAHTDGSAAVVREQLLPLEFDPEKLLSELEVLTGV